MNYHTELEGPTLPEELSKEGYQTHLVGKLHFWPLRKLYGFMSADWSDFDDLNYTIEDDYSRFLEQNGINLSNAGLGHGIAPNSWISRPWHLEEHLHPTNWTTQKALEFLDRRDPTMPFFLNISFTKPHQACTPPRCYWDRYMNMDLAEPFVGEWAKVFESPQTGLSPEAWRVYFSPNVMHQYRAGYYGSINHIDDQIGRILESLPENTIILFTSDHGEMLGDHQWTRKRNAFEPSTRVSFLLKLPQEMDIRQGSSRDEVMELMDVMPTLLDAAGIDIPDSVEGKSILPLLKDSRVKWRDYVHGECADILTLNSGMQYLTDGNSKYIWYPGRGEEQFFDLKDDPHEMYDLSGDAGKQKEIEHWRAALVKEIKNRPEGFVKDGKLAKLGGPTSHYLPGFENLRPG